MNLLLNIPKVQECDATGDAIAIFAGIIKKNKPTGYFHLTTHGKQLVRDVPFNVIKFAAPNNEGSCTANLFTAT